MLRILIVNNGVQYPKRIASLFPAADIEVVASAEVVARYPVASHDCIVLSGSSQKPIPYFRQELEPLLGWILNQTKPLWGICYGAELLAAAYGGKLHHLGPENKIKGHFATDVLENQFGLPPRLCLYEGHQWIIEAVASPLVPVMTSPRGVLMFHHASLPQVGTMFHPEKYLDETDGRIVTKAVMKHFNLTN